MKKFITVLSVIVSVLGLSGCSTSSHYRFSPNHKGIDPELYFYVQSFVRISAGTVTKKDLNGLTVGFRNFGKNTTIAGLCYATPFFREVDININWWYSVENIKDYNEREELIFHELGHCILYRVHTSPTDVYGFIGWFESLLFRLGILEEKDRLFDGCPSSYMHPNVLGSYCIDKHHAYYMQELFKKRKNLPDFNKNENRTFIRYSNGYR